jgi:hypothetical protein
MSHDAVRDLYLSWTAARTKGEPPDPEGRARGDLFADAAHRLIGALADDEIAPGVWRAFRRG